MKSGRISLIRVFCLAVLLLAGMSGELHAGYRTSALEAALQSSGPEDELRVIVRFSQRADIASLRHMPRPLRRSSMIREMQATAEHSQQSVKALLQGSGIKDVKTLWVGSGVALQARPEAIYQLTAHPAVESIQLDLALHKDQILLQSFAPPQPNINQVGASDLWPPGYHGQGAVVALMDTGADVNHPDLAGRWRGGTNSWFDPYEASTLPFDNDGHGTSVLGIMVGGDAGGTTIGAAPAAKWIAARMFDGSGTTFLSVIHQLFQWFLDPDSNPATDDAPDVVNGSWGFETLPGVCDDEFQADIDALNAAGIAAVFASGNGGPNPSTSISPANYSGSIAVGFVDASSIIYPLSSRGPSACDGRIYPDVVAPGVNIKTTDLSFGGSLFYSLATGSSFSTPHASGALALLKSAFPDASVVQLKSALVNAASPAAAPDNIYGNGLVDALSAFNSLQALPLAACVRPDIDFDAAPYPAGPNQPITFSSSISGGTPGYTFAWDFNGDGVTDCVDAACTQTYSAVYAGSVGLTVTDANGCSSTLFIANGWAACTPISPTFSISPAAPVTGQVVTYTAAITGGTAPFSYEWDLDADGIVDCTTATCTKTYSAVFNGNATLRVSDRYGCSADVYAAPVTVAAAPPSSGGGGGGGGGCFLSTAASGYPPAVPVVAALAILTLAGFFWSTLQGRRLKKSRRRPE
jgi:bacillopeptidase F